jgi:queuine tRNA-ribosyltransferase
MAAIQCYEEQAAAGPARPLQIISFENDLDSLRLAVRHNDRFLYLRHSGPAGILDGGQWQSRTHPGLSWSLVAGNFLETMSAVSAKPDVIFYDMFSSKTDADVWTAVAFRRLFHVCEGRPVELFTYTCSTPIRVALLAAGFCVAKGRSTGEKTETTIALTPEACREPCRHELLASDWLAKWHRSGAKFPAEIHADQHSSFEQMIREHWQFQRA